MINNLSNRLTLFMLVNGCIKDEEKDIYNYGLFMMLSQLFLFIITCILGSILNCFFEAVIFYTVFQIVRKYAGGYHAMTETMCEFLSVLSILMCLMCIKWFKTNNVQLSILVLTLIAIVSIFVLCPLDTPEKPLTKEEFDYFRKISWVILLLIIFVIGIGWYCELDFIIYPCCMSLILESILLILGKIKKLIKRNG